MIHLDAFVRKIRSNGWIAFGGATRTFFRLHDNGHLQGRQEDLVFQTLATENNAGKASAIIDGLEDSLSTQELAS